MKDTRSSRLWHRVTALALSVLMVLTMLPTAAMAAPPTSGPCGENVTWSYDKVTQSLTLRGTGPTANYSPYEQTPWVEHYGQALKTVTIADGVTVLGDHLFRDCTNLRSVTIPESVTVLEMGAFAGCTALQNLSLPKGLAHIDNFAFQDCTSLRKLTLPEGLKAIDEGALNGCTSLEHVTIPQGIDRIGTTLFADCTNLKSVTIPKSVTGIESSAFRGCTALQSLTLPESVTTIDYGAFENCASLEHVNFPQRVTYLGIGVMKGTAWEAQQSDGPLYLDNCFLGWKGAKPQGTLDIRPGTRVIAPQAMSGCDQLKRVTIPQGVTAIGIDAFSGCTSLQSINLPAGVTTIAPRAFQNCASLERITIPQGVTEIGMNAFDGCTSLQSAAIPGSVTTLGSSAFSGCTALESITLPEGITTVGSFAFYKCPGLRSVSLPESLDTIGYQAFADCTGLSDLTIPRNVTHIGSRILSNTAWYARQADGPLYLDNCLLGWKGAKPQGTQTVQSGTRVLADDAFSQCSKLTALTLPAGVKTIGNAAFSGCTGLRSITIPESVTTIGGSAFSECASLQSLQIPNGVTALGGYAFDGCTSLSDLTIPESVTHIGSGLMGGTAWEAKQPNNAYLYLDNCLLGWKSTDYSFDTARTMKVRPGTRVIADMAAGYISYIESELETLTIPDSVVTLGDDAFAWRNRLASVTFSGHAPQNIGSGIFEEAADVTAYYPAGDSTWTPEVMAQLEDVNWTWIPYTPGQEPEQPLPAPQLDVTNTSSTGKPYLKWNAVDGAVKYEVYYSTSRDGTYNLLYRPTGTTLKHGSANAGTTYYYKVRAVNASGTQGEFSNIDLRTCDLPRPDVKPSTRSDGKPILTWQAIPGAVKYEIYARMDDGDFTRLTAVTGTKLTHSSAKPGHTYTYKVRALASRSAANSAWSYFDTIQVEGASTPELTVTNTSSTGKPYLKWTAVDGAVKYEVYYSTSKTGTYKLLYRPNGTTLKHGSANAGTTYYYKVRAVDANGAKGEFSPYKLRTCDLARPNVTVKLRSGHPYLDWQTISGAVKYEVYCSVDGGSLQKLTTVSGSRLTHSSAKSGHTYRYRVKAIASKSSANSAYSYYDTITVK